MLAVQRQKNFKERMEPRYFRLDIHVLMSTSPILFWLLDCSVVTWAFAKLSVLYTFVRKGRRVSLLKFCDPCHEVFMLTVLMVPPWRRGDSVPASLGYREWWVLSIRVWVWVTEELHSGPLSARPWSSLLRPVFWYKSLRHEDSQTSIPKCPMKSITCPPPQQIHKT